MSAQTAAGWRSDHPMFRPRPSHCSSPARTAVSPPPPQMRLMSPLKSQSLLEAFVRSCSCKDHSFDCSSCSCTLATPVHHRGTPRSALAELKNIPDPQNLDGGSSPSPNPKPRTWSRNLSQPPVNRQPRSNSVSPSPKSCSKSRGLSLSRSGKRSYSESGGNLPLESFKENDKVAEQQQQHQQVESSNSSGNLVVSPFKRKRPPKLQIPADALVAAPPKSINREIPLEVSAEAKCFGLYSRKGHRDVLEDTYQAVPDIDCETRQAFFGIFDGHGGRMGAEFAADNLCRNIREALSNGEHDLEGAVRTGYLTTDAGFLQTQGSGGASCVTAFVENDVLVVANAGDCRAVLSKNGLAIALTQDHRLGREDERRRVEELGAYVDCFSGVWRLQGSLAVSRGIGDRHLKEWVSAEPEIHKLLIDSDCEFLILASDGLWDVVSNQEAVDCIRSEFISRSAGGLAASSKKLVQLAASRGSQDDISVMVVNMKYFCTS